MGRPIFGSPHIIDSTSPEPSMKSPGFSTKRPGESGGETDALHSPGRMQLGPETWKMANVGTRLRTLCFDIGLLMGIPLFWGFRTSCFLNQVPRLDQYGFRAGSPERDSVITTAVLAVTM